MLEVKEDNSKCINGHRFALTDMGKYKILILK